MSKTIQSAIKETLSKYSEGKDFDVLIPPNSDLGDYSVNLAFKVGGNPVKNAEELKSKLQKDADINKLFSDITIVAPGFINFKLSSELLSGHLSEVLKDGSNFGDLKLGNKKINIEFVSANPTGPATVHNARAAAFGDTLGNILKKVGYKVAKEYYINDIGVQVGKLAESIRLRKRELNGEQIEFAADLYQGEYIKDIAKEFIEKSIPDENIQVEAIKLIIGKIRNTFEVLGVVFDEWFYESKLHESGEVGAILKKLEAEGFVVQEDEAKWLKIGDDQKAVLVKKDGSTTYLMNDIAYTKNKFDRGFDKAINIWGTDHHGDVPRLKAGVAALGYEQPRLEILLHQLVMLKQKDQKLKMSKRAGNLVLLTDLINDVGKDVIRFFFLSKDLNTHMEFDLDLAKEQSKKNPVFYIQYAFARLNSVFDKAQEKEVRDFNFSLLSSPEEQILLRTLSKFPDIIESIAKSYQVHHLANYTQNLATQFHHFYEKNRIIQPILSSGGIDKELEKARLALSRGVHTVLKNCLDLMGLDTPNRM